MQLLRILPLTPFFADETGHENYVNIIISIRHIILELLSSIHSTNHKFHRNISSISNHHPNISSFIIFIHVNAVFIRHNCFGISSIHTFQPIKCFIQIVRQLIIAIQKVHWCSTSIQTFHPFCDFHPFTCGKYFPRHSYTT